MNWWFYDSAAWLADDIFVYHVSQGNFGKDVPRVVFDRFARVRDLRNSSMSQFLSRHFPPGTYSSL